MKIPFLENNLKSVLTAIKMSSLCLYRLDII